MSDFGVADAVLSAARIDRYHKRLYCIGPAIGRISFASQQMRALNLIWALRTREHIRPNSLVAVVGGGLAGLSAATALLANQCTVKVFEEVNLLHRQKSTQHRNIHPSINWWPSESGIAPTTALPYLNWTLGQCNDVIKSILDQWSALRRDNSDLLEVFEETTVKKALNQQAQNNRLILKTTKGDHYHFDAVILASGFGDERDVEKKTRLTSPSYWDADGLEKIRNNPGLIDHFVVSGFGDGGLIDTLRIAYEFDFGKLSFRMAEILDTTEVKDRVRVVEAEYGKANWPARALDYETIAQSIFDASEGDALWRARELLERTIARGKSGLITLIDNNLRSPYESAAAPIHKLMIAYAMIHAVIKYETAEITPTADVNVYDVGAEQRSKDTTHFIIRIGAPPYRHGTLVTEAEWTTLIGRQEAAREYSFLPAWQDGNPLPVPKGSWCPTTSPEEFVASMKDLAWQAFSALGSNVMVKAHKDRFVVVNHKLPYRPETLFGKCIDYVADNEMGVYGEL